MKEATGELNMTVIVVVAIAAVGAFFYAFVWPNIRVNIALKQACNASGGKTGYWDDSNGIGCTRGKDEILKCFCVNKKGACVRSTARVSCEE